MTDGAIFLDLEDLFAMVRALGIGPVADVGLLEAACARPPATAFGEPAYASRVEQAAALLHSLVGNHALVDGNKRLGWLATTVFLDLNGATLDVTDDEAFDLVMRVAEGVLDAASIATVLAAWLD